VVKTNKSLTVQGTEIHLFSKGEEDYISLTDMTANFDGGSTLIQAWLRNKNTVEFLGTWEKLNNPNFNYVGFEVVKNMAGLNRFTLSVGQWRKKIGGIGLLAKEGRYGGTFAHKDIAAVAETAPASLKPTEVSAPMLGVRPRYGLGFDGHSTPACLNKPPKGALACAPCCCMGLPNLA